MKVLVTGGTGLLGWWIVREFLKRGYKVYATYHTREPVGLNDAMWVRLDLEDFDKVIQVLKDLRPDIVVHSAAYTDVDGCELHKDKAYRVNYLATKAIAQACNDINAYMIYISTDYVFDGEKGMYKEDDVPNPINFYGLSKLMGEIAVESVLPDKSCIVRVSGLYGYSPTGKRNFGINALESLIKGEEVKAFHDQYLSPTFTPRLAEALGKLVEKGVKGVIHIVGERLSRYQFALILAERLGVDKNLVRPISMSDMRLIARRPRDSSLDTSKAKNEGLALPPIEVCIGEFIEVYKRLASRG